jgi:membrane-associated protein
MLDSLADQATAPPEAYLVVLVLVAVDSVLPLLPGEAAVITGAILAADGELSVLVLLLAALAGGLAGDNLSFGLGALLGRSPSGVCSPARGPAGACAGRGGSSASGAA